MTHPDAVASLKRKFARLNLYSLTVMAFEVQRDPRPASAELFPLILDELEMRLGSAFQPFGQRLLAAQPSMAA